jgi:hypothetical protein
MDHKEIYSIIKYGFSRIPRVLRGEYWIYLSGGRGSRARLGVCLYKLSAATLGVRCPLPICKKNKGCHVGPGARFSRLVRRDGTCSPSRTPEKNPQKESYYIIILYILIS